MKSFLLKPYHTLKSRQKRRQINDETLVLGMISENEWVSGYDIHKATGLRAGRIYAAVGRLQAANMVNSLWDIDPPVRYKLRLRLATRMATRKGAK